VRRADDAVARVAGLFTAADLAAGTLTDVFRIAALGVLLIGTGL
jgi:hypothetical protein